MSKQQTEFWSGKGGDDYHKRNQVDWLSRANWWSKMFWSRIPNCRSVLEIGCGPGWNLSAINSISKRIHVSGVEINAQAAWQASMAGLKVNAIAGGDDKAELVFTAGVMIHIPPNEIDAFIGDMINRSYRWVMAIEYEADEETKAIEYRGQKGLLWKRPYGEMLESRDLRLIDTGSVGPDEGFDSCTYWLFEK